jgi:hypothetical protein
MTETSRSVLRAHGPTHLPDDEENFEPFGAEADDAVEPPEDDERLLRLAEELELLAEENGPKELF